MTHAPLFLFNSFGRFALREDVKRRLEAICTDAEHLAASDVVTGARYRVAAAHPAAIEDTTEDALNNVAEHGADVALPIPRVADSALRRRSDQLAGIEPAPSGRLAF
jgi:hypothetical protein